MNQSNQIRKTALYCRLSQNDGIEGDSNSIQNQKAILQKFAEDHHFPSPCFYVDDGFSGGNFQRPAFQQMISDMGNGEIGIIVTKDLSRLGRNQLHTGLYIEERFPMFGVRYIAINDNVDTDSSESNDLMPFKNLFNEWFIRDTSRKIRAVLKAKAERGERLGTRAPYGYRKDPGTKKLIVDEEAASIVRRIFAMCAAGSGPSQIARILKKEQILTPTMYAYTKYGITHVGLDTQRPYHWSGDTVADMLENEIYLGNTVNMKHSSRSYKDKRRVEHPREECLVFENTHPALITREVWDMVQRVRKNKRRLTKMEEQNLITGSIPQKESEIQSLRETAIGTDSFLDKAKRYTDITELTPELLWLFIEKILVHEKEVKWSKHAPQTVEIYYNGIGYVGSGQQDVEEALEAPEPQGTEKPRQAS